MILSTIISEDTSASYAFDCLFNYKPYIPKKRIAVKKTQKGTFTQKSVPLFCPGEDFISWTIELTTGSVAEALLNLYNLNENFTFTGAWGDVYRVEFSEFDAQPKAGYFKITGKFRVLCIIDEFNPNFKCT